MNVTKCPFLCCKRARRNESDRNAFRAVKPLDLAKKDPTSITVHGDEWLAKIKHLKKMEFDVSRVLFAVQLAHDEPVNIQAAEDMFNMIQNSGVRVTRADEIGQIVDFARAV